MINLLLARVGAVCYVLWGLVHYNAAYGVFKLASSLPPTMAQGRLNQCAFYLVVFATASIVLGIALNWHNSRAGFWLNLLIVSVADIAFIVFMLVPGYSPIWPGIAGPVLWIAGLTLTGIAQEHQTVPEPALKPMVN